MTVKKELELTLNKFSTSLRKALSIRIKMVSELILLEKEFDAKYFVHLMNCNFSFLIKRHKGAFLYIG